MYQSTKRLVIYSRDQTSTTCEEMLTRFNGMDQTANPCLTKIKKTDILKLLKLKPTKWKIQIGEVISEPRHEICGIS